MRERKTDIEYGATVSLLRRLALERKTITAADVPLPRDVAARTLLQMAKRGELTVVKPAVIGRYGRGAVYSATLRLMEAA